MPTATSYDTTREPLGVTMREIRRAWRLRTVGSLVIAVVLVLACFDFFGYRSRTLQHEASSYTTAMTYGQFTRRGITTPLRVEITAPSFDDDLTIAINDDYLERFAVRQISPQPDSESSRTGEREWTFSQPDATRFTLQIDAEIDASAIPGWVDGVLDVRIGDESIDSFTFRTWIYP